MHYSEDLRKKALNCVTNGMHKAEVSKFLSISRRTLDRWIKQKRELGHLRPQKLIHKVFKIDPEVLKTAISQNSDLYQKDLAKELNVSQSGICRAFKRLGITRKKRPKSTKSVVKKKGWNT